MGIETWALYGERTDAALVDWMHAEPIQERSRLHGYAILPHRHALLFQVLHLTDGRATLSIDGERVELLPPVAVTLPPLVAHGYEFSPDVAGTVLSVFSRDLAAQFSAAPELLAHLAVPRVVPLAGHGPEAAVCAEATRQIMRELARHDVGRDQVLAAQLTLLLTALRRVAASGGGARHDGRAVALVAAFQQLVDAHFTRHAPLADYAGALGITPGHLNRICRAVAGASALALVNRRLLLEAKRHLAFTNLGVKQIAGMLGFEDAAYFTRFFGREAGLSPSAFRAQLLER